MQKLALEGSLLHKYGRSCVISFCLLFSSSFFLPFFILTPGISIYFLYILLPFAVSIKFIVFFLLLLQTLTISVKFYFLFVTPLIPYETLYIFLLSVIPSNCNLYFKLIIYFVVSIPFFTEK